MIGQTSYRPGAAMSGHTWIFFFSEYLVYLFILVGLENYNKYNNKQSIILKYTYTSFNAFYCVSEGFL